MVSGRQMVRLNILCIVVLLHLFLRRSAAGPASLLHEILLWRETFSTPATDSD